MHRGLWGSLVYHDACMHPASYLSPIVLSSFERRFTHVEIRPLLRGLALFIMMMLLNFVKMICITIDAPSMYVIDPKNYH